MVWQEQLKKLENSKQWDEAIEFMQGIVSRNPNSVDAYLCIIYLLMDLLVEENYDSGKHAYYAEQLLKYFNESYAKFSNNPEYLAIVARIGYMSEWYFKRECEDLADMLKKAFQLAPQNILCQWGQYSGLRMSDQKNREIALPYARKVLESVSLLQSMLISKGSLGEFILGMMIGWSKKVVAGN